MLEQIEFEPGLVKVTFTGDVVFNDLAVVSNKILNHPNFQDLERQLWRFETVKKVDLDAEEIQRFIEAALKAKNRHPESKIAIVAGTKAVFGLARMYSAYADQMPWETLVFSGIDEALDWLNPSS